MNNRATIIPVAGGKGGVGKTLLTANLGIALAKAGIPTIVIDLDLGGSNLHSALGLPNRFPGIGNFLKDKHSNLEDYLVPTQWESLRFLPGDSQTPFMANISFAEKIKVLKQLSTLPAKYILLDLGAGSSYNTLDSFRVSPNGLLVTTPEKPALMNMMTFLKNTQLRIIARSIRRYPKAKRILQEYYKHPENTRIKNISSLHKLINSVDREAGLCIENINKNFRPRIIMNMARHPNDLDKMEFVNNALQQSLSIQADCFGVVFEDKNVRDAVDNEQPLLDYKPDDIASRGILRIADRIERVWDQELANSHNKLYQDTHKFYSEIQCPEPTIGRINRLSFKPRLKNLFGS
ncbi:MAG: P-loop NTPase [Gammaproteobacteria bacterium]|nr:P-loop NTPase [Gammaproteobacteria bacterium]